VLINATPMGMAGQPEVPVELSAYPADTIVFDMVYFPLDTGLIKLARGSGMRVIDGLHMLVAQAAPAFEMFFGLPAPREHDAELRALLTS
jgi:shikimate dehydrogenase